MIELLAGIFVGFILGIVLSIIFFMGAFRIFDTTKTNKILIKQRKKEVIDYLKSKKVV